MFGAIDAGIIMELARRDGVMYQQELDLECPIWVFVKPEYLTDIPTGYSIMKHSHPRSSLTHIDHPYFASTRDYLEREGYIECVRNHWNGDRVVKPFFFNNVYKEKGDQFSCAAAMKYSHSDLYNNGEPLPVPNYKSENTSMLDGGWTADEQTNLAYRLP